MSAGRRAALCLLLGLAGPVAAEVAVPPLSGPVVDRAGVLDAQWTARLERLCRAARALDGGNGPQLQYLIVKTLDGEPIESFSMRAAEAWKLGTKGKDNGVLVVVALEDRRVRIEVGGGVEGGLTDIQAGRIIRDTIAPAFREGRYGAGLYAAGRQILGFLGALPEGGQAPEPQQVREIHIPILGPILGVLLGLGAPFIVFIVLFLVVVRILGGLGRSRRGPWDRWGGGGFGGGSFGGGGGGWSGGGGGFSGGGASGSW
ncbi:MAG TPA: TPM domain-containing protein [Anaeromyxobacteraceae bacterium]|nr:TPM domain-containing protein [Anaeromyxobacteraceae bacterium]